LIIYEEYHPFGTSAYRAVDSTIEVSPKRYRYAAAERDEETGLDHMGLRYYAPWLGRWTSADPIGLGDGVNRYAYVHGNPVSMRDPGGTNARKPTPPRCASRSE
jgi:RHS repeat-associated protein